MNALEMQEAFLVELGLQSDQYTAPDSKDIFYFLNQGQTEWVKDQFKGRNKYGKGFERDPVVSYHLRDLVEKDSIVTATYNGSSSGHEDMQVDRASFPCCDFMFFLSARARIKYDRRRDIKWKVVEVDNSNTTCSNGSQKRITKENYKEKLVRVKIAQTDDIYSLLMDPFNRPDPDNPIADISEEGLNVYCNNNFLTDEVVFNYLREPNQISRETNQDCELPKNVHHEIVNRAIIAFTDTRSQE